MFRDFHTFETCAYLAYYEIFRDIVIVASLKPGTISHEKACFGTLRPGEGHTSLFRDES